jgi:hypothetical protein
MPESSFYQNPPEYTHKECHRDKHRWGRRSTIVTPEIRNIGQIVEILKFTQYDYEEKTKELQQRV